MSHAKNPRVAQAMQTLKVDLEAERAAILAQSASWQARRAELVAQIQPLEVELRAVDAEIDKIEQPRLRWIGNELAAIARQSGARSIGNTGDAQ